MGVRRRCCIGEGMTIAVAFSTSSQLATRSAYRRQTSGNKNAPHEGRFYFDFLLFLVFAVIAGTTFFSTVFLIGAEAFFF